MTENSAFMGENRLPERAACLGYVKMDPGHSEVTTQVLEPGFTTYEYFGVLQM